MLPTQEQLQRFVGELNSLPPRPDTELSWLIERYYTLDMLQTMALRDESLYGAFAYFGDTRRLWGWDDDEPSLAFAQHISVDWNIVMQQVNDAFDDPSEAYPFQPPAILSPGNLFISVRSRRIGALMTGLSMPAFQATREAIRRTNCVDHLRSIALAMLLYEREHGTLPPAYLARDDGQPLHSWRVLLLPYLGEQELYEKIRLGEPWDSEHNRQFHEAALGAYHCPSADLSLGETTYSVVVGEQTAFQGAEGKSLKDFGAHLILVVERHQSVCWMDPTSELDASVALEGIASRPQTGAKGLGSPHPGGVNVALRNGSALFITETMELPTLRSLLEGTAKEGPY
jgi:hypothetical protein